MDNPIQREIGNVITALAQGADDELFALQDAELERYWFFRWDEKASIEWNTYKFSDLLELYKRQCRRWEERHNGSCCVVERVRDKYLMPKVKAFLAELESHPHPPLPRSERPCPANSAVPATGKVVPSGKSQG